MKGMYKELGEDYFDHLAEHSKNPIRKWFHTERFRIARSLVMEHYAEDKVVVDLGCGSCTWNTQGIPVIGVDSELEVLAYALRRGRLREKLVGDVNDSGLPPDSADIVLLFGVLEHITSYRDTLKEAHRILKPGGIMISSVPHDTWLSLWKPLYRLHCFVQGTLLRKPYFMNKGGHINSFSPKTITAQFNKSGFDVTKQFSKMRMEVHTVCIKR